MAKIMREETLRKSLEQLSDREREILLGRFYYQKSSTELGRQLIQIAPLERGILRLYLLHTAQGFAESTS